MNDLLGVTVEELLSSLKEKNVRLPFEIGAFVGLETCESLLHGPASVGFSDVRIGNDGRVAVFAPPNSATGQEAAKSIVALLAHVLLAAGPGIPPALVDIVEHGPSDGRWDLSRLRDELEAALVPLNRQAARRVLARMIREAKKSEARPSVRPKAPVDDVDADLDALIGPSDGPTRKPLSSPAVPPQSGATDSWPRTPSVESSEQPAPIPLSQRAPYAAPPAAAAGPSSVPPRRSPAPPAPAPSSEPAPEPGPVFETRRGGHGRLDLDLSDLDEERPAKRRNLVFFLFFILLTVALLVGVSVLRPDAVDRAFGREAPEQRDAERRAAEVAAEQQRLYDEHDTRYGQLVVRVEPERSQVLLYVGRGPATAKNLPQGIAHEFVAIADGYSPTRAVVPKDAPWQDGRYELAIQTGDEEMTFEDLDLGSTRLPRDMGQPGDLGEIRIITNPPGAKVYQVIGFAPLVQVDDLSVREPVELLVFAEGHAPRRAVVGPSDWREADGLRRAEISVQLQPK